MQIFAKIKEFLERKKKRTEYFLVLVLGSKRAQALIFGKTDTEARILGKGEEELSTLVSDVGQEELAQICDRAIGRAEENLPPNVFTSKTILCLIDDWVQEGSIKKEYLQTLRFLKENLELEFIGFVVLSEAVSHLLQKEEGVPITSILVGHQGDNLVVTLIRGGKVAKQVSRKITEDLAQVLASSLRTFKDYEILPTRIVLFGEGNLEEIKQELINFPWTKTLPFLHLPKIETLDESFIERAVIAGFATQMGVEFETPAEEKHIEEKKPLELPPQEKPRFKMPGIILAKLPTIKLAWDFKFNLPNIRASIKRPRPIFLLPLLVLVLVFFLIIFIPQAKITLSVTPKTLELAREITIDPSIALSEPGNNKIKGNLVEIEVGGSEEGQATGKKEVGERATGEVTISNKTTSQRNLKKGSILSANNLKFTLDNDVNIASASDTGTSLIYGTLKVKVTASALGEESNLPSNASFTINDFSASQFLAKNDVAFSGGSKKEVNVVSKKDQENLTKTLLDNLQKQASEQISNNTQGKEKIVDQALTSEILEKKFSKNIDEEASKFLLTLKVKFKTLSFGEEELKNLFSSQVNEASGDFVVKQDSITISLGETKLNKNKSVTSDVNAQVKLLPKINERDIKNKIKGKNVEKVFKILGEIPNISDYKIKVSPTLPLFPVRIPWRIDGIKIIVLENG